MARLQNLIWDCKDCNDCNGIAKIAMGFQSFQWNFKDFNGIAERLLGSQIVGRHLWMPPP